MKHLILPLSLLLCASVACGDDAHDKNAATPPAGGTTTTSSTTATPSSSGTSTGMTASTAPGTGASTATSSTGTSTATSTATSTGTSTTTLAPNTTPPEIAGSWASEFGLQFGFLSLGTTTWDDRRVIEVDNALNLAIVQSPEDAAFGPGTFSKITWTEPASDKSFFLCEFAFGLGTLSQARDAVDDTKRDDPATGGCGEMNFAWTRYIDNTTIELEGVWANTKGVPTVIDSMNWKGYIDFKIIVFNNASNQAIYQNPEMAGDDLSLKYSRVSWTEVDEMRSFSYCEIVYGKDTVQQAIDDAAMADPKDLDAGCNGFPWSKLTMISPSSL